jgi:1-aminocyclopropane-1-carboxylate deaminase/D-cysteine desulfhydrase-like pyridoxal-dependent ACC family enzyme
MKPLKVKTKPSHYLMLLLCCLVFVPDVNAQFLKKLKKRVEQRVEDAVIEKTANKAAEKATQSMDKIFEINPFGGSNEKADPALVADSYDFTWKYTLKMSTKEGEIVFDYYLKPDVAYFGFTSAMMNNMFTVMDNDQSVMAIFMDSKGNNIGMVNQIPEIDIGDADDVSENFTFETLPDKTINGFDCKGVKAVNEDYEMTMYFITDAEISFDDIYKSSKTKIPDALKDYFNEDDKILMIHMDMKNLKKKKESATMECIGLEEIQKTINKSDYKFM